MFGMGGDIGGGRDRGDPIRAWVQVCLSEQQAAAFLRFRRLCLRANCVGQSP